MYLANELGPRLFGTFTLLYDLVPISDPPLLQKNTQDLRSAPG